VMAGRIRMALDNCNTLGHSPIPWAAARKFLIYPSSTAHRLTQIKVGEFESPLWV